MESKAALELPALAANERATKNAARNEHPVESQRWPVGIPVFVAVAVVGVVVIAKWHM